MREYRTNLKPTNPETTFCYRKRSGWKHCGCPGNCHHLNVFLRPRLRECARTSEQQWRRPSLATSARSPAPSSAMTSSMTTSARSRPRSRPRAWCNPEPLFVWVRAWASSLFHVRSLVGLRDAGPAQRTVPTARGFCRWTVPCISARPAKAPASLGFRPVMLSRSRVRASCTTRIRASCGPMVCSGPKQCGNWASVPCRDLALPGEGLASY